MLTLNQLKKEGFQLTSRCPLCHKDEESLEHLLIHCLAVWGIWVAIISLPGMDWVCPLLAKDLMVEWKAFPVRKKARKIWKMIPSSLFWEIWKERNKIFFFLNENFSSSRLKQAFINSLTTWVGLIYEGDYSIVRLLLCIL